MHNANRNICELNEPHSFEFSIQSMALGREAWQVALSGFNASYRIGATEWFYHPRKGWDGQNLKI
jgi:hypothetical protein